MQERHDGLVREGQRSFVDLAPMFDREHEKLSPPHTRFSRPLASPRYDTSRTLRAPSLPARRDAPRIILALYPFVKEPQYPRGYLSIKLF